MNIRLLLWGFFFLVYVSYFLHMERHLVKRRCMDELSKQGIKGYCYQKENQYYVLSMISENRQEIDTHASQVKGILKTYKVSKDTTIDILLQNLAKGVTHD